MTSVTCPDSAKKQRRPRALEWPWTKSISFLTSSLEISIVFEA